MQYYKKIVARDLSRKLFLKILMRDKNIKRWIIAFFLLQFILNLLVFNTCSCDTLYVTKICLEFEPFKSHNHKWDTKLSMYKLCVSVNSSNICHKMRKNKPDRQVTSYYLQLSIKIQWICILLPPDKHPLKHKWQNKNHSSGEKMHSIFTDPHLLSSKPRKNWLKPFYKVQEPKSVLLSAALSMQEWYCIRTKEVRYCSVPLEQTDILMHAFSANDFIFYSRCVF